MFTKNRTLLVMRLGITLALLGGLMGTLQVRPVLADTIMVTSTSDNGTGSLRQAIVDAVSGDTITFDPSLAGQTITLATDLEIDKTLTIDGSGLSLQVTISGGDVAHIMIASGPTVIISDLTISDGDNGGIFSSGNLTIINSTLMNNNGNAVTSGSLLTIINTSIYGNAEGALLVNGASKANVVNSTITQNQGGSAAIFINGGGEVDVFNSTIIDNANMVGFLNGNTILNVYNSILACTHQDECFHSVGGDVYEVNSIVGANGTLDDYGLAELADNGGPTKTMALYGESPLIGAGDDTVCANALVNNLDQRGVTRPQGGHCDIGAYEYEPVIRYVDINATGANDGSSWTDAFTDLQSALAAASRGDQIWVAAGTYKPTPGSDRTASFVLKSGVELYGNFSGTQTSLEQRANCLCPVILSGDIGVIGDNSDNSYHVVVASNTDGSTLLDDFTITSGNANGDVSSEYYFGGGMYNDKGSPRLNDVTFTDNYAGFGGGMYNLYNTGGNHAVDLVLTDVTFSNNTAASDGGGMAILFDPNLSSASFHLSLTDVTFKNNTATVVGGGISNSFGVLTLNDVTFSGNTAAGGGGLYNFPYGEPSTLTNVTFTNNSAEQGGGGMLLGSGMTSLTNVTFNGNSTIGNGGGLTNLDGSELTLTNVTFGNNTAGMNGGAISNGGIPGLEDGGTLNLINTTLNGNTAGSNGGAVYNENGNIDIGNSILYGNTGGEIHGGANVTYSIVEGGYAGTGNLDADPLLGPLQDNGGPTLTMAFGGDSPAVDAGNDSICPDTDPRGMPRPQDAHCDMGAYEYRHVIHRVKRDAIGSNDGISWANAYTDLQSALAASLYGDEIWVAAGTYYPTSGTDRTISFNLQNGVKMYGGFSGVETSRDQRDFETNVTILSGDIGMPGDNSDNSYHVVTSGDINDSDSYWGGSSISSINSSTVLDGFTITDGNANGELSYDDGGGMKNVHSHPIITNVTFTKNSAAFQGGGVSSLQSNMTLTNVSFMDNSAHYGGGLSTSQSNPVLMNVIFNGNSASDRGGGMYNSQSDPTLTNVTISGNSASDRGGGMYNIQSDPMLTNVTISENSASDRGGGMYNSQSDPTLTNVTVSENLATTEGGGMYNVFSNPIIRNTILWGNTAPTGPQIYNFMFNTSPVVNYSIVEGGYAGTDNIDAGPLLGPLQDNGGFTQTMALGAGSPAIDNGSISVCPATDQRGVTRPQDFGCDIGAYEYDGVVIHPTSTPTATLTATSTPSFTPTSTSTATHTPTATATESPLNTIPELIAPVDLSTVPSLRPDFDWSIVPSALKYNIQVSKDTTFKKPILNVTTTPSTYTPTKDLPRNTLLYWRVRTRTSSGWSNWSEVWSFTTGNPPPPPILTLPRNNSVTTDYTTLFAWKVVTLPTGTNFDHYQIQVDDDPQFGDPEVDDASLTDQFTIQFEPGTDLSPNTKYYWRVRAFNTEGHHSNWSKIFNFRTAILPPTLLAPTDGSTATLPPILDWEDVPGAKGYTIQVSLNPDFKIRIVSASTVTSMYTLLKNLPPGTTVYWRVQAKPAKGSYGPSAWSDVFSFTTP